MTRPAGGALTDSGQRLAEGNVLDCKEPRDVAALLGLLPEKGPEVGSIEHTHTHMGARINAMPHFASAYGLV